MSTVDTVRDIADSFAPGLGLEVFDVEFAGGLLRVTADRVEKADPKSGTDLSMLQKLSKSIARVLEEQDTIPGSFTLEVSSPGVERKLRTRDHFARSLGEVVKVKTFPGVDGDRRCQGNLVEVGDSGIEIVGDDGSRRRIAFDDIAKATTVFEWGPQEKPGRPKKSSQEKRSAAS